MAESLTGGLVEVEVGAVAHGGHCVARLDDGRVVFVRHTAPGERVVARITEDIGKAFCRADAVEILHASPARVPPPCRYARPGHCGGCDWQHVSPAYQRELKAQVVAEQLLRLGGLEWPVVVEDVGNSPLGWRTRIQYAVDAGGHAGLRRHRSHAVERIDRCLIGAPGVGDAPELARRWPGADGLDVALGDGDVRAVAISKPERRARRGPRAHRVEPVSGPTVLHHEVAGTEFAVSAGGFWQVHPEAARVLTKTVLDFSGLRHADVAVDLYAGAGLFTAVLAARVGAAGSVHGLEADRRAVVDAAANLAPWPWAEMTRSPVTAAAVLALGGCDVTVLDPPRTGAGREVIEAVLASTGRSVVYIACDPAALARDVRTAAQAGWRLVRLRALDLFPMTHHVECVALFQPLLPA